MNTEILNAIGLEAFYSIQKRAVFASTGRILTRNEFLAGKFPAMLDMVAVLALFRAGIPINLNLAGGATLRSRHGTAS